MGPGERLASQRPSMVSGYRGGGRTGGGRSVRGGKGGRVDRSDRMVERRLDPSPPGEGSRKVGGYKIFKLDCEMHVYLTWHELDVLLREWKGKTRGSAVLLLLWLSYTNLHNFLIIYFTVLFSPYL